MTPRRRRLLACAPVVVAAPLFTLPYFFETFRMPSASMLPTLRPKDLFVVRKRSRTPGRGDVIVFDAPGKPGEHFVKRVVALGGDTVELRGADLIINGKPVPRQHIGQTRYDEPPDRSGLGLIRPADEWRETLEGKSYGIYLDPLNNHQRCIGDYGCTGPFTVPAGALFVLGDNRDNSHDSRFFGPVPLLSVRGKAVGLRK